MDLEKIVNKHVLKDVNESAVPEISEEEAKLLVSLFDGFWGELEESGKSQFVAKLIGYGVLDKDEKTGKLKKTDKKMSTKEVIAKAKKA